MKIVNLLKELDQALEQNETLILCGGMAVALAFGGTRETHDVDVIAPVPLSKHLLEKVKEVALATGADPDWLNDSPKGFADYLPKGWQQRLVPIALGFKKMTLYSLGKVDLIMLKLKAARERDLEDIRTLKITKEDAEIILENLERVEKFDRKTALIVKLQLEEWNLV